MKALGLHGSPRKNGNSAYLMGLFMEQIQQLGHDTRVLHAPRLKINHCTGCGHCEKNGVCAFDDDFTRMVMPAMAQADLLVLASPVYFYGFPSALKALIDRVQVAWSRKYRLKTGDQSHRHRKGILLAVAATHGNDLFDGLRLTARYFFDAADFSYEADLCYRGIDQAGQMQQHPTVKGEIRKAAQALVKSP